MICLTCRKSLVAAALNRARAPRLPQWQPRAHISSAPAGASASDRANSDYVPSIDISEVEEARRHGQAQAQEQGRPTQHHDTSGPRFSGMQRRRVVRRQGDASGEKSLEIFEKMVRNQVDQGDRAKITKQPTPASLEFYNNLARLRPMMQTESLETCLDYFFTNIWDKCPYEGRNRLLKQRGAHLMSRVVEAKMEDLDNERLPSLARCTQIFDALDNLGSEKWANSILGLILNIASRSTAREDYSSAEAHGKACARKEALLHDIIDSWAIFHRCRLLPSSPDFRFPDIDDNRLQQLAKKANIRKAMGLMLPQLEGGGFWELPAVAIASYVILSDPAHTSLDIQQKALPLLQPMGKILAAIPIRKAGLAGIFRGYPDVLGYVLGRWDSLMSQLRPTSGSKGDAGAVAARKNPATDRGGISSRIIHNQVTNALNMGDVEAVEAAWTRFWGTETRPGGNRIRELQESQELFQYFIMVFMALHRPQKSMAVWDSMLRIGIEPTLKTWTSLIEGCRRSRNAVGIENVWKKLQATGVELDDAIWSARIVGLVDCRQPEAGLRALDEMLRLSKLKPDSPLVAKLTRKITSVNAAVAALMRLNAMPAAMKVLTWAAENGIEPDVVTYNTLLRPMVQQGNSQQVDYLLKMMKSQSVEPDAATFTVLLDGLMCSTKDATQAEQVAMVHGLLSEMEAVGLPANKETFARMIHLLLREPGANAWAAVDAIRGYMGKKGLRTSPQIYTILLDHHFSKDPPDLDAVEALIDEGGFRQGKGGSRWRVHDYNWRGPDRVFWERVIKGYAMAGRVDQAYEIFDQTAGVGSALTLDSLEVLLRALVREGRAAEAGKVVDKVLRHREGANVYGTANTNGAGAGGADGGDGQKLRGRYWRHGFWGFALDCGLVSLGRLQQLEMGAGTAAPGKNSIPR